MPRTNNDHERRARHARDESGSPASPKRHKRSRSREKTNNSFDHRKSSGISKMSSQNTHRKDRNIEHNSYSYNTQSTEGRWGSNNSGSDSDDHRNNIKLEQSRRKSRSNDQSDRDQKYKRAESFDVSGIFRVRVNHLEPGRSLI